MRLETSLSLPQRFLDEIVDGEKPSLPMEPLGSQYRSQRKPVPVSGGVFQFDGVKLGIKSHHMGSRNIAAADTGYMNLIRRNFPIQLFRNQLFLPVQIIDEDIPYLLGCSGGAVLLPAVVQFVRKDVVGFH